MYDYSMRFANSSTNFTVASHQSGPFLAQLFALFNRIAGKTIASAPVLSLHATHDTTIKPILNFFGLVTCPPHLPLPQTSPSPPLCNQPCFSQNNGSSASEFGWPPYSAMLVFELRQDGGQYFVRVVYNGKQIALPVLVPASNGLYALADMTV